MTELLRIVEILGAAEDKAVTAALAQWNVRGNTERLLARDKNLWTGADEDKWLGWLDIAERERRDLDALQAFARETKQFQHVVLIGMGGSSLGPDVIARSFGSQKGWPGFHMIDSTDPDQIRALDAAIELPRALFIVSSKSGTTLESNIITDYFFERAGRNGRQFAAVTDLGSALERTARGRGFAHVFHGDPAIGGRYSVLSKFGLVPAAAIGIDLARFLEMPDGIDAAIRLGVTLGVLARDFRRDKVTIFASPKLASLGAWLEQLIAESTGKQGRGLIPIDGEPIGAPESYGEDRIFLVLSLAGDAAPETDALAQAGHPVIRIALGGIVQLGQFFYLAEFAIAVAGAILGVNPFDQPDVEASKIKTRALTDAYERTGKLEAEIPIFTEGGVSLFADAENMKALGKHNALADYFRVHLARAGAGDYVALLAYIARAPAHEARLNVLRGKIRDAKRVATCLGFGPRFLHSTGQAYKGGPNSGVFIQITCDHSRDLAVPGKKYSFGVVEAAQAHGDFTVLTERERRALRVHFRDLEAGLESLDRAIDVALRSA
jgi:transaldolase / glucose-6-phosphate isomerase